VEVIDPAQTGNISGLLNVGSFISGFFSLSQLLFPAS
jgi:hypothetical protein